MRLARILRLDLGLNHSEAARRFRMSVGQWQKLELQSYNPTLETILKLWVVAQRDLGWTAEQFLAALQEDQKY